MLFHLFFFSTYTMGQRRHDTLLAACWRFTILVALLRIRWLGSIRLVLHPGSSQGIQGCVFIELGKIHTAIKQLHDKATKVKSQGGTKHSKVLQPQKQSRDFGFSFENLKQPLKNSVK